MLVRMQVARIVIVDSEEQQASMIVLHEIDGHRAFPILIGVNEAYAIDRRTKGQPLSRPLTHDLLYSLIEGLGGKLERIVINELREQTFYAKLVIKLNGEVREIDSRPSDALAICAGTDVPVFVDESVLDEVC
jgi:bifunctional DNase/RNase